MAVTVAMASIKGGVGKTSAAVNLAAIAAAAGQRTMLWDLDPQGAATYSLGIGGRVPGGALRLAHDDAGLDGAVAPTSWPDLDVIPADFSLRHLDLELAGAGKPRRRLARALEPIAAGYDVVVIDCPPGITLAIEGVLRATDVVLVPVIPSVLPMRAFDQLQSYVAAERKLERLQVLAFLSMVDRRKRAHRELADRLADERHDVLHAAVPASVLVEAMPVQRVPLVVSDERSAPAAAYRALWAELGARLGRG